MSSTSSMSTFMPSDLVRYLVHSKLAVFDDIGLRLNLPASTTTTILHGPSIKSIVYLFYYLSFGTTPIDSFNITCAHSISCFTHECAPCGEEVINIGCPFWSFLTERDPLRLIVTNTTLTSQILKLRFWQMRIPETDVPEITNTIDAFCGHRQTKLLEEILGELKRIK